MRARRPALCTFALAALTATSNCSGHGCATTTPSAKAPPDNADAVEPALAAALAAKGKDYVPHTRHKNADGSPKYTNRLILEASPYLLEHAHNPVDWYPWGDAAFLRARRLNRPVFLSIGYSTCHWCHVMEDESFEDEAIAQYLNEHYVAIKVDREERPDVDAMYMTFVELTTGGGGWPMSSWLTADREPFFAGTYFAPQSTRTRPGFLDVLVDESAKFTADPAAIAANARAHIGELRRDTAPDPAGDFPSSSVLLRAEAEATKRFDPVNGGTTGAPKFPSSFPDDLLLRIARRTGDEAATAMVATTLAHLDDGGIHDRIGGGFHRYATDRKWLVPHFEKMLYDNALLAMTYLEGFQATGSARFAAVAREILDYVLRDLAAPDGTFYSATDADSDDGQGHSVEGAFYTWTAPEIAALDLGPATAPVAMLYLAGTDARVGARGIVHLAPQLPALEAERGLPPGILRAIEERQIIPKMRAARGLRPRPFRDEKVLVAWNALAIRALARAAIVFGEARYAEAAMKAAAKLLEGVHAGAPLAHAFVDGKPVGRAFADDHALLAAALVDVFQLTARGSDLDDAIALEDQLEASFLDGTNGGYFLAGAANETLPVREKPDHDGPIPTPSSVAALTELRLFALTGAAAHRDRAERTIRAFARTLDQRPLALDQMLVALDWATDAPKELVIALDDDTAGAGALSPAARPFLDALATRFVPNAVLVVARARDLTGPLGEKVPFARDKTAAKGATAYVCENGTCKLPTRDPKLFATQAAETRPYPDR